MSFHASILHLIIIIIIIASIYIAPFKVPKVLYMNMIRGSGMGLEKQRKGERGGKH